MGEMYSFNLCVLLLYSTMTEYDLPLIKTSENETFCVVSKVHESAENPDGGIAFSYLKNK